MSFARMSQGLAAFAVHAVTTPAARGRGVFSTLELQNEQEARGAGATWALGFTNPLAGPILVGKLGWEDVTVAPDLGAARSGCAGAAQGALRVEPASSAFAERRRVRRAPHRARRGVPELALRRLAAAVRAVDDGDGWAVVTHAVWHGFSSAVDLRGRRRRRAAAPRVRARRRRPRRRAGQPRRGAHAISRAGFVPTPRTIRFIGKRLTDDAPELPKRRDAWHFTLGDLDFF